MSDSAYSYLDQYCERSLDSGLWAEPINALSNLAFIIAAFIAYRAWASHPHTTLRNSFDMLMLSVILAVIGVGSALWHIFADAHTLLLDVIPIVLFMNIYLIASSIRLLGFRWWQALYLFAVFQGLNIASEIYLPRNVLNGTILYIPAYLILAFIVVKSKARAPKIYGFMRNALLLWSVSLVFRTVDRIWCDIVPIGTHFLWHTFNACVLLWLLLALINNFTLKKQ